MSWGEPLIKQKNYQVGKVEDISLNTLVELYEGFSELYSFTLGDLSEIDISSFQKLITQTKITANHPEVDTPQALALLSYMLLEYSRIPAMGRSGEKKRDLKNQDRKLWDRALIDEGLMYLKRSAQGNTVSLFHLKAAVSACHSLAKDWRSTDWKHILSIYDSYLELNDSPEMALERTEVLAKYKGPRAEIKGLEEILMSYRIQNEHLLYDRIGDLRCRLHEYNEALACYEKASRQAESKEDKSKYRKKIRYCKTRLSFKDKYAKGLSF